MIVRQVLQASHQQVQPPTLYYFHRSNEFLGVASSSSSCSSSPSSPLISSLGHGHDDCNGAKSEQKEQQRRPIAYIHLQQDNKAVMDEDEDEDEDEKKQGDVKNNAIDNSMANKRKSGIIFLPGFQSSMWGTKSQALYNYCIETSREFTALDYGEYHTHMKTSEQKQQQHQQHQQGSIGTIGQYVDDVLAIFDNVLTDSSSSPNSKQILVGSSMGAWIMILVAMQRPERIGGLVGIGAAPDFTKNVLERQIINVDKELSARMDEVGYCEISSQYSFDGFYRIYKEFLLEAENHFVLTGGKNSIRWNEHEEYDFPVVLIHGTNDKDIGCEYSNELLRCIDCRNKKVILVDGGDHRLSSPSDIDLILNTVAGLI